MLILSAELEKSYEVVLRRTDISRSYANSDSPPQNSNQSNQMSPIQNSRPIPTGPRAYKKPRLSDTQPSPTRSHTSLPNVNSTSYQPSRNNRRERTPRSNKEPPKSPVKRMDIDGDKRPRSPQPRSRDKEINHPRDHDRETPRERGGEREREHEKDWNDDKGRDSDKKRDRERDRSRRNGLSGGGGKRGFRGNGTHGNGGDRTLAERMGLRK